MSSYGTSANQSMESGTSSLLRSGLNISVGDTKSIVLALQALQQKIRALEQDRDFHQAQYDRALQAHETYKLDMERQAEKERAEHRRSEQELMELLRHAREEKVRLETAMVASTTGEGDLSAFRAELEKMIEEEKTASQQREGKLRGEITRLRQEINEEHRKHAALQVSLEKLRAEREAAYDTNDELRAALDDLERLRKQTAIQQPQSPQSANRRGGRNTTAPVRGRNGPRSASNSPAKSPSSHSRGAHYHTSVLSSCGNKTYRDPTCSSRLRDVRNAVGDVSCSCEGHLAAAAEAVSSPGGTHNKNITGTNSSSISPRSGNPSALRTRPAPAQQQQRNCAGESTSTPMAQVEAQLREELSDLQQEYQRTVARAAAESLPRHVVNTALARISELIDKKEGQLRLMQHARREVGSVEDGSSGSTSHPAGDGGGIDKAAQRAQLVNELRSMLADSGKL